MLNLRSELRRLIAQAIAAAQQAGEFPVGDTPEVIIEYPPERAEGFGDYASPVALSLAQQWNKPPLEVASKIAARIPEAEFLERVAAVKPGFLNLHLRPAWLSAKLDNIIREGEALGRSDLGRGVSINLEFVSANPTGLPHVGNGRALFAADVLGTVLAQSGYAVTREYYINDLGTQVAKYGESVLRRILQAEGFEVDFPSELYQGDDVREIARRVREVFVEDRGHRFSPADLEDDTLKEELTRRAVDATVSAIRHVLEDSARVHYDIWFPESRLHEQGEVAAVLADLQKGGHTYEKEGATWLKTTAFGDDQDRVLVKRSGELTYLAADIAYHRSKIRRGFQIIADFWGADHHGHIAPLRAGLAALGEDPRRLRVELAHIVRVFQGGEAKKVSKRAGTAVPLRELLHLVGLSAVRFFLTMKPLSSTFDFDLDLAAAQREENPVYYAQYAFVRLTSILRKAKERNVLDEALLTSWQANPIALAHETEHRLQALALRLPEVLEDIVRTWEVQRLPQYALELAQATHRFYDSVPVLNADQSDLRRGRLVLTLAVHSVLGKVFDLLGVEKREVM